MNKPLLHYKRFGDSSHPATLILLHGMLGSMDNWRSQAKRLAAHFQVITPDLRNHGRSPHLPGMRYQDMAQDVLDLANHLGIAEFALLGHSMGGKIAMMLALQHPSLVSQLIVVDIAPKPYQLWHLSLFKALQSLPINDLTSRKQANNLLSEHVEDTFERAFLLKNLQSVKSGGYVWRCNLEAITRAYLTIANFIPPDQATFTGSTLFIRGAQSDYISVKDDPVIINRLFPSSTLQTIDASGHNPHAQNAAQFYQRLSQFLSIDHSA